MVARFRPNAVYVVAVFAAIAAIGNGVRLIVRESGFGAVVDVFGFVGGMAGLCGGVALLALLGVPIVASTVFRVPVVAVDEAGIRLPLMGLQLGWAEISAVTMGVRQRGRTSSPVLLIVPADPKAVIGRTRPWLRSEVRANLARHGAPIVLHSRLLDRSLDDIAAAVRRYS